MRERNQEKLPLISTLTNSLNAFTNAPCVCLQSNTFSPSPPPPGRKMAAFRSVRKAMASEGVSNASWETTSEIGSC